MSTQDIQDYINKQIFIEKNIVTYRSLSRHLGIHVNAAKNELATYHHNAPYHSQTCVATFLLSGVPRSDTRRRASQNSDEDFNMDSTQDTRDDSDDGDEVPQTSIMIVNEKDLEDAKSAYEELNTIHVYSLSPAPLIDAGLLCGPTEPVRSTDKLKGTDFVTTMGRIIGEGIKVGAFKKKVPPALAAVAGPSKSKPAAIPEPKVSVKAEPKEKTSAAPEKPKPTGKLNFFKKPEKTKDAPEVKKIKQEEPETAKKMFFSKSVVKTPASVVESTKPPLVKAPSSKAASPAPSVSSSKDDTEQRSRGVKRKSSVGLSVREASPATNSAIAVDGNTRRRRIVLSDDEEDMPVKSVRKSRLSHRTDSTDDSFAEGDARLLMDIDDDEVEKVSRVPSTNASSNERDENEDADENASSIAMDEDVHMTDNTSSKPKVVRKRKPKQAIPVGRNGVKKRKVTKTRRTVDSNGYVVREDYSDWESVASDAAPEPPAPAKAKKTASVVKTEEETQELPAPVKEEKAPLKPKAPTKAAPATKAKTAPKAKTQKAMMTNFFKKAS